MHPNQCIQQHEPQSKLKHHSAFTIMAIYRHMFIILDFKMQQSRI